MTDGVRHEDPGTVSRTAGQGHGNREVSRAALVASLIAPVVSSAAAAWMVFGWLAWRFAHDKDGKTAGLIETSWKVGMYRDHAAPQAATLLLGAGLLCCVTLVLARYLAPPLAPALRLRRGVSSPEGVSALVVAAVGLTLAVQSLPIVGQLGGRPADSVLGAAVRDSSWASFGWLALAGCVAPAVGDELFFRGFFQHAGHPRSPWRRLAVGAALTGILGTTSEGVLPVAGISLFMGWVVLVEGSVLPAMIARATTGLSLLLSMKVFPGPWSTARTVILIVVGIVLTGIGVTAWRALLNADDALEHGGNNA